GFEHGPARSFAPNPDAYDPRYHFELAIEAGCSGYAAPLGFLEAGAREFAGEIPLILKLNDHDVLFEERDPTQALTSSVADAARLGCVGVGFTIYPGSVHRLDMYGQIRAIAEEAKRVGMVVVIWSYPRGSGLSRDGETAIDVTAYAAHIAAQLGAHIVKVKLPSAHIEQEAARKVYTNQPVPIGTLPDYQATGGELHRRRDGPCPSRDVPGGRESIVEKFLAAGPAVTITSACFGIAGAVVDGRGVTTNLPWVVDERTLARRIPAERVTLLNDLEAAAFGVLGLGPAQRATLQTGTVRPGNMALIAAGTGLGE